VEGPVPEAGSGKEEAGSTSCLLLPFAANIADTGCNFWRFIDDFNFAVRALPPRAAVAPASDASGVKSALVSNDDCAAPRRLQLKIVYGLLFLFIRAAAFT